MANDSASAFGQSQAQLISTVCSNILLFCGLLVAGTFTLLASDSVPKGSESFLASVAITFTLGFAAGLVALLAIMGAHNLARRAERVQAGLDPDDARVQSARRISVRLSNASFILTIVAAVAAFVTVCLFIPQLLSSPETSTKVVISKIAGGVSLQLSGEVVPEVKILRNGSDCNGVVALKEAEVLISKLCN